MKCPTCSEAGKFSTAYLDRRLPQSGQIDHDAIFWDEAEHYHVHDKRPYVVRYRCSEGHRWQTETLESCPSCEVGHEEPKVVVL